MNMRHLAATHQAWIPNAQRSRLWYGRDGLFLIWPNAANDVRKLLEADQLPGIPKAPETLVEILIDAGVVEPSDGAHTTWAIFPPHCDTAIEAIRLESPSILLAAMDRPPEALPYVLVKPRPESPAVPTSAAASSARSGRTIELPLALPAAPDTPLPCHPSPVPTAQQRPESVAGDELELSVASSSPAGPTGAGVGARRPTFSLTAPLRLSAS